MPEWMLKKDDYILKKDKDAFINKSILALLQVLSKFRVQNECIKRRLGINELVKLISTFLLILLVSLAHNFTFVLIYDVFLLILINFLSIDKIKNILKTSLISVVFTFIILLPSIILGYGGNAFIIIFKVLTSVISVNILANTVLWSDLVESLKIFHIPDIFILVLDITIKYIVILGEFSLNMLYALKLRSVGKSDDKKTALSGIIGTMFIKSKEMSEEMYDAMECRGFTGEYKTYKKIKFKLIDYIAIMFNVLVILIYFYFERI